MYTLRIEGHVSVVLYSKVISCHFTSLCNTRYSHYNQAIVSFIFVIHFVFVYFRFESFMFIQNSHFNELFANRTVKFKLIKIVA